MFSKNQTGFLMIEVLVAVVIISVALVAVAGLYIQSTRAGKQSTDYTIAATLAQDRMERVKADQIVTNPEVQTLQGTSYQIQSQETAGPTANLSQLQVTVSWTDLGVNQSIVLTTYLARNIL